MTKKLLLFTLWMFDLNAKNIVLTAQQEANWQIKTEVPKSSQKLPLGEFVVELLTPPSLLHTVALPFEANVKKLYVADYQSVSKGQVLAEVSGTEWIAAQQKAIADAIEFAHHKHLAERKNMLCKEEIIPKKECVAANAELEADTIKVSASKALLESYGASDKMIATLFKDFKLSPTIQVKSTVEGKIVRSNAAPGRNTAATDALFVIQEKGSLWIESAIEAHRSYGLKEGQKVQITLENHTFDTRIIQLSAIINPENQTRQIRFLLPLEVDILSGLRANAKIELVKETLMISKTSVIKDGDTQIVFVKNKQGYTSVPVEILSEDDAYYFVKPSAVLQHNIAVSSLAVLKNMLGNDNE